MAHVDAQWIRSDLDRKAVAAGYTFDLARAEAVRDFFARFLRHSKGKWAGKPFELFETPGLIRLFYLNVRVPILPCQKK